MICFIALIVFAVLGIFSAKYRAYAFEAWDCVFRKITLRKCDTGLDERIKAELMSRLSRWPKFARFTYRHFEGLSMVFTLLMLASFVLAAQGAYNYWAFGNCNGPGSSAFCVFSAITGQQLVQPTTLDGVALGNVSGDKILFEFGCFTCPYTRAAWPGLKNFTATHPDVRVVFKPFPLPNHPYSTEASQAALCAEEQGKFVRYADYLFQNQTEIRDGGIPLLEVLAVDAGLNSTSFDACLDSNATLAQVRAYFDEGIASHVYGTPTFFFEGRSVVGPMSEANYADFLAGKYVVPDAPIDEGFCAPPLEVNG
ncbi:hypothetical protein AUJ14_03935 [Candidatus Micrarchaeota archaeon CG1_02_55_22]|nr:MAG: hypothetical protein AUJ14_03935 [Candidatus Micrarchaeota archaeon CG1_02_55_22]